MTDDQTKSPLCGRLLLAMPGMNDPRFHRAVIFLCAHDAKGAMGLVINNPLPALDFMQLLPQLNIDPPAARIDLPVLSGGPVENARGFVLHGADFSLSDTIRVNDAFGVTGTVDALRAVASGQGPRPLLFMLGYAGWEAGQLERELQDNVWLIADALPGLVFDAGAAEKWERCIRQLGVDPAMLSAAAGHA